MCHVTVTGCSDPLHLLVIVGGPRIWIVLDDDSLRHVLVAQAQVQAQRGKLSGCSDPLHLRVTVDDPPRRALAVPLQQMKAEEAVETAHHPQSVLVTPPRLRSRSRRFENLTQPGWTPTNSPLADQAQTPLEGSSRTRRHLRSDAASEARQIAGG